LIVREGKGGKLRPGDFSTQVIFIVWRYLMKTAVVLTLALATVAVIVISLGKIGLPADPASGKLVRMNSLMVIVPYKYEGMWVFDDPAVGLHREPFIAGIDTLIDKATLDIPDAQHGFRAIFSAIPFPGANFKLQWRRAESGGDWYFSPEFNQEGWLCPALLKYFTSAPPEIYVKVEPRTRS
jgi:hypothetical protein